MTYCLPQEAVDPAVTVERWANLLRFDKELRGRVALTLETGASSIDGVTVLTDLRRNTSSRSRARLSHPHWNV